MSREKRVYFLSSFGLGVQWHKQQSQSIEGIVGLVEEFFKIKNWSDTTIKEMKEYISKSDIIKEYTKLNKEL